MCIDGGEAAVAGKEMKNEKCKVKNAKRERQMLLEAGLWVRKLVMEARGWMLEAGKQLSVNHAFNQDPASRIQDLQPAAELSNFLNSQTLIISQS
jgi:hypothetical protein